MWFRRKQKNRRLSRGRVLDVKLRSDQVRASRMRLASLAFGVAFGTVFGLYLFWRVGEWTLDRLVYENKSFAIQQIEVQTDGVIAEEQLRRWSGVKPGQNLMALDLATVKRNLELVSLVGSVSVERVLPRTLRIRVSERDPVAQVNVLQRAPDGGIGVAVFQLDADGYVIEPLDPRQRATPPKEAEDQLPTLTGVNPLDLRPTRRVESPQVQAALRLVGEFDHSPMAGLVDLQRIDVASPEILIITTGQGSEVTFGLDDFDRQLLRWREAFDHGRQMNRAIASLDLAVSNNIPVRWLDANASSSAPPKFPKPPRNKKKNV